MKITIVCSEQSHPINIYLEAWAKKRSSDFQIEIARSVKDAQGGDILFLISCSEFVRRAHREKYRSSLVLHASDLPEGRGWSPHIWDILEGSEQITLSLLEAEDQIDSGAIWHKVKIPIPKYFLWDEINEALFRAEIDMLDFAIENIETIIPSNQTPDSTIKVRPRRTPKDSELNPSKSIEEQFDLIRICDPSRFPAFFHHLGKKYILKVEKCDDK